MSSSGYLVPPSKDPSQEKLWVETWKRIDRFLPELRKDLFLEEEEETATSENPTANPQGAVEEQAPVQTEPEVKETEKGDSEE